MPDITMCATAAACEIRESCYLFKAAPSFQQSWADFKPGKKCKDYLPMKVKK